MTSLRSLRSRLRVASPLALIVALLLAAFIMFPARPVAAATLDVCASGCTYSTIQSAITAASNGDTVSVGAGTYTENLTISGKYIALVGAGSGTGAGDTIVQPAAAGAVLSIGSGGPSTAQRQIVQNIRFTGATGNGITISGGDHLTFDNVTVANNSNTGIEIGIVNDLIIIDSTFSGNVNGLRLGTAAVLNGAVISDSHFDGNEYGIGVYQAGNGAGVFNNVEFWNSTFNNNLNKGIYLEKASNVLFDHVTVNNSGTNLAYNFNNGVDINLKFASYDNIEFRDSVISNSGVTGNSAPFPGAAINVKARDDAPSYNTTPASLTNFRMTRVDVINNPAVGIRFGEQGKNNNGPVTPAVNFGSILNNGGDGLVNTTASNVNAENNWWGCNNGPNTTVSCETTATLHTGTIDFDPWLTHPEDDQEDDGGDDGGEPPAEQPPATNTYPEGDISQGTGGAVTASGNGSAIFTVLVVDGEGNLAAVGDPTLISLGVVQAVDVFMFLPGGQMATTFEPPVQICLRGVGTLYFRPAADQTGTFVPVGAFTVPGYVCTTLTAPGLLVLVGTTATAPAASASAPTGGSTPLTDCQVTTDFLLRLRADASTSSDILTRLPMGTTLDATEMVDSWYRVIYGDQQGWVSADYVSTSGNCG